MPLTATSPITKKSDKSYKIARKPATPKIILAQEARFTLPTAFKMEQGLWKIRLAKDSDGDWRHICNYEMPDLSKEILQEIWDYWDGHRKFNSHDAFYPTSKDTLKHTGWPRYIPHLSGIKKQKKEDRQKKIPGIHWQVEEGQERVPISTILRWQVDGEEEEEDECIFMKRKEPAPIFMEKQSKTTEDNDAPPKKKKCLRCLCNHKH